MKHPAAPSFCPIYTNSDKNYLTEVETMDIATVVSGFFKNDQVEGLLINLISSWIYDKRTVIVPKKEDAEILELELADVLRNTFRKFYEYKGFTEFDSEIVLSTFFEQFSTLNNTP